VTDKVVDASAVVALLFNELTRELRGALLHASYLWLARALNAELVTLDDKLARADKALRRAQWRRWWLKQGWGCSISTAHGAATRAPTFTECSEGRHDCDRVRV
jgi:uncharacterized protein with PIN domain